MNAHYSMSFITFYLYIFSELQFYISFNILLDNEVMETSKRRSFLPLVFIIKSLNINDLTLPGSTPTRIKNKIVYYLNAINTGRYWDITVLCKGTCNANDNGQISRHIGNI